MAEFVCPDCRAGLLLDQRALRCTACGRLFPVVGSTPVLLPASSVFDTDAVTAGRDTYYAQKARENPLKQRLRRSLPSLGRDWRQPEAERALGDAISLLDGEPVGLVIGAGERPSSLPDRFSHLKWITTDVGLEYGVSAVADVTGLPLPDGSVDVVYIDQVLEHVVDIAAAANEIQRVLAIGGIVFAGIPFTYPWHGIPYDFYRVTPSGIRALFRQTETIYLDVASGPWTALAKQVEARLVELFRGKWLRRLAAGWARLSLWPLKYLDLRRRPNDVATAASLVYIGRRTVDERTPADVVRDVKERFAV